MRIATWNVNGLRARLDFALGWLAAQRPDVVGLQELKLTDEQFPREPFEAAGYRVLSHGQKAWNGVAVLSREPAEAVQTGLPGQEELGARLLSARLGKLVFVTLYCPNGKHVGHPDYRGKLAWFDSLADHLEASHSPVDPLVVCGDFNICAEPIDSWNEAELAGTIFHTDEERQRLRRLFDWGLTDLYRRLFPERQEFSWWDYRGGAFHRNRGLRIDLLLGTAPVTAALRGAEIDREYRKKQEGLTASDHAPVVVDVAL